MKKVLLWMLALSALTLAACGGSSNSNAVAILVPVPAEYSGKTNPLGADAASAGAVCSRPTAKPATARKVMAMALPAPRLILLKKTA